MNELLKFIALRNKVYFSSTKLAELSLISKVKSLFFCYNVKII